MRTVNYMKLNIDVMDDVNVFCLDRDEMRKKKILLNLEFLESFCRRWRSILLETEIHFLIRNRINFWKTQGLDILTLK